MERKESTVSVKWWVILILLIACLVIAFKTMVWGVVSGEELAMALRDNVVRISTAWKDGSFHDGFGFLVGERGGEGFIVTANHVVRGDQPDAVADRVEIEYYRRRGERYTARLLETSDPQRDLAVLKARLPADLSWRRDVMSSAQRASRGTQVWFIGRLGEWYVPVEPSKIYRIEQRHFKIKVDCPYVVVGTSGAPLITEDGIVGMIITDAPGSTSESLTIDFIHNALEDWGHPWQLTALRKGDAVQLTDEELIQRQLQRTQARAIELMDEGKLDRALDELREASQLLGTLLEKKPSDPGLIASRGYLHKTTAQLFLRLGETDQADEALEKALEDFRFIKNGTAPDAKTVNDAAAAANGIGNIYHQRGEYKKAIKYYELATELVPSYAYAWHDMFGAYVELAKKGEVDLDAMRLSLTKTKETGMGRPGLSAQYIERLESILKYYDSDANRQ